MSKTLIRLGRLGYGVKGIVYIVMGLLALFASFGKAGANADTQGALITIGRFPFGRIALLVIAVGLLGYTAWRLVSAATDAERKGDTPTGIGKRLGAVARGLAYGSLGVWTLRYLKVQRDDQTDHAIAVTDRLLEFPGGSWLVVAIGFGFFGYAVYQVYRAMSDKFLDNLSLAGCSEEIKSSVRTTGKFGIMARAAVFGMIGALVVSAGWNYDPTRAGGIQDSLNAIAQQPTGEILLKLVSLGLMAFGIFQIATARYRVMRST